MADAVPDREGQSADGEAGVAATLLREPRQDRSRRTLRRILEAGLYLLEHEGPEALTVTEITKRARTSVGSFYARFNGKDGLLRYMGERSLNEALQVWGQLREGLHTGSELRESMSEVVTRLGWLYLEGPGRSVVLLEGIEDPAPSRRRRLEDRIAEDFQQLGGSPIRSNLATRVLTGVLQDATVRTLKRSLPGPNGSPYPGVRMLLSELTELVVGYLGGEVQAPATEPEASDPSDHAALSPDARASIQWEGPEFPPPPEFPDTPQEAPSLEPTPLPRQEIDTDTLILAALAGDPPVSQPVEEQVPGPVQEPLPDPEPEPATEESSTLPRVAPAPAVEEGMALASSVVQRPLEPREAPASEPAPGPEPAPELEAEGETEEEESDSAPTAEPDPFDVWG